MKKISSIMIFIISIIIIVCGCAAKLSNISDVNNNPQNIMPPQDIYVLVSNGNHIYIPKGFFNNKNNYIMMEDKEWKWGVINSPPAPVVILQKSIPIFINIGFFNNRTAYKTEKQLEDWYNKMIEKSYKERYRKGVGI